MYYRLDLNISCKNVNTLGGLVQELQDDAYRQTLGMRGLTHMVSKHWGYLCIQFVTSVRRIEPMWVDLKVIFRSTAFRKPVWIDQSSRLYFLFHSPNSITFLDVNLSVVSDTSSCARFSEVWTSVGRLWLIWRLFLDWGPSTSVFKRWFEGYLRTECHHIKWMPNNRLYRTKQTLLS